ncbi:MAG: sulfatase-like hydrolase/transferase [Mariniblastus sp.]|nr:sulfatase-like hydrolase/transferase [Mariniblastus sp.]
MPTRINSTLLYLLNASLVALVALTAADANADEQVLKPNQSKTAIFDGETLNGWQAVPADCASDWQVKNGMIVGTGTQKRLSYLTWNNQKLTNFDLSLSYRLHGKGNTGIEVRSQADPSGKRPLIGYHADLGHPGIGKHILGAWDFHFTNRKEHRCDRGTNLVINLSDEATRTKLVSPIEQKGILHDQWNQVRIVARKNHFKFFINGQLSSEFTDNYTNGQFSQGGIGLQVHDPGMKVEFKDIYLAEVSTPVPDKSPNVLLIAIDDLNDWVGCLGGHPQASSPNIDRLAKRGTLFTNAHCQAPICNPSRTSIMYGLRPSTSGVYMNAPKPWTVTGLKENVTLSRHFAANGYKTYTTGKIYHTSGLPDGDFDVVGPRPGQRLKIDQRLVTPKKEGANGLWDFGAQSYDEKLFQDHQTASWAIDQIQAHETTRRTSANPQTAKPFFMAIGFYRPHVPFYSPKRIFDQIPLDEIELPLVNPNDRDDLPAIASELMVAPAAPDHAWFVKSSNWRRAVQSYLSCIRFTDEQVGRLLDTVYQSPLADNTIVILYSDHGFFLGEKERWAKQSLWERATRVPFIIVQPGGKQGQVCSQPAELLSIYPTLIDLCGLSARDELEGNSLIPLLNDPKATWHHPALTTHGKDNHSVRTDTHRYIRYRDGSEELYDLRSDPNEWTNIANQPEMETLKSKLKKQIPVKNADPAIGPQRQKKNSAKQRSGLQ